MLREYRTLLPLMRRYLWWYIGGIICVAITSGGQIAITEYIRSAVNEISAGGFELRPLAILMLRLIAVAAAIAVARFGWRFLIHGASRRIESELRARIFEKLLSLQPSFYSRSRIGDLMAISTNDMNSIRMASGMALVALFDAIFPTAAIVTVLFVRNPSLAAIIIVPLPFITALILIAGRSIRGLFLRVQEGFSSLSQHAQEILSGVRVVKSFVKERFFLRRFSDSNTEYQKRNMKLVRIWGLFFPIVNFLAGVATLLLLGFGGRDVIMGSVTPGDFVATLSYLQMLIWPMIGAGFTVNMIQRGAASLERVNRVLDEEPEIRSPENGATSMESTAISIRHLSFTHPDTREPVLSDVSLEIPEGTILGILGRTGSGKSTLLSLLSRMDNPPRGSVFIGGTDVLDYDLATLRGSFGVVPQDTFLFSATLRENIAFGVDDADQKHIQHVADVSTISRDMQIFPHGWETEVGERGITLSGGQKQRVAISRALAKRPRILVFDDALSAVDTETEELILNQLLSEREGTTSIIVSHRVSTLASADHVAVLDRGRLVQFGTHEELLAVEGFYQEVAMLQRLSEERRHAGGDSD